MVICLEQVAVLHMSQLMPLPLIVSCFSEIQIGFTSLVPAHPGSPGKRAVIYVSQLWDFVGAKFAAHLLLLTETRLAHVNNVEYA